MTGSLHPDGGGPGAEASGPASVPGGAPEVVDFDLLDAPVAGHEPEVVDFGALAGPRVGDRGGVEPERSGSRQAAVALAHMAGDTAGVAAGDTAAGDELDEPLTSTVVEVAVLDKPVRASPPPLVVDVESVGRSVRRTSPNPSGAERSSSERSGAGRSGAGRSGAGRARSASARADRSGGERPRSSFGDDGSRTFGGRSRGAGSGRRAGGRGSRREWGIQLDAEVDEPSRPATEGPAVPDDGPRSPVTDGEAAGPAGPDRRSRPGGRGRAGSFGRSRRAGGEPAPEYEDPEQAARQICLTALTGAARTRQQLADLLAARDVPADAAESVLERFTEVGLIDDAAFAAAWVSSRQAGRGLSRRALADELRRKGVDKEVASVALEAVDPQDEWDTARALVARKVPGMRRLDHATATRRLTGQLTRKGYSAGLAAWVVREALEADGKAEDAAAEADDAPPDIPVPDASDDGPDGTPVRRGLWSGRPLDEVTEPAAEVGEGLGIDGWARTRSARRRPR